MIQALAPLLLTALLVSSPSPQDIENGAPQEILRRALEFHQAGRFSDAIGEYEKLLQLGTPHPDLLSNLGAAYASAGRPLDAIAAYRKALELGGQSAALHLNLGLILYKTGETDGAIEQFQEALKIDAQNVKAASLLADCQFSLGSYAEVIRTLDPFRHLAEAQPAVAYLLGTALIREDRVEEGQPFVDIILRRGDSAEAHLLLASGYRSANDLEAAEKEVRLAIGLNPGLRGSYSLLGELLMAVSGIDQIRRNPALVGQVRLPDDLFAPADAFRKELELDPNNFQAHFYLGYLLGQLGEYETSLEHLQKALELRPAALQIAFHQGQVLILKGSLDQARLLLERLVEEVPMLREARAALATVYHRLGLAEKAAEQQKAIVELTQNASQ